MEELRKQILLYLEKHSRVDLGELAVLLGTDEVTVANEISAMERAKIICGYHTLIDWDKTGTEYVNALIEVKVTPQRDTGFDKTAERICNFLPLCQNILSCAVLIKINGCSCFVTSVSIICIVKTLFSNELLKEPSIDSK